MKKSLKAFMREIIDYAGLFPPANLSLDTSIQKYAAYRTGEEAWMLSRFIIPAGRLSELEPYHEELFEDGKPFDFSVLGSNTDTLSDFREEIEQVIESCQKFHQRHGGRVTTDILEMKLPKEAALSEDRNLIRQVLDNAAEAAGSSAETPRYVFYEGYFAESWKNDIPAIIEAISAYNEEAGGEKNYAYSGFKLRCGGVEAHMIPEVEKVAHSINTAREYNVPIKCTAGLHHPVRHYDDSVQTKMHGFFNVFGGAMLAYAHDLNDEELGEILKEEDPENFSFTDHDFRWKDLSVTVEELEELRDVAVISFGSCSFEEPIEDLQRLQLL